MDTSRVPRDVLPLVEAMNQHILRNRELLDAQRRFVDDASHQLRTPLSTLQTQLSFAQRASDLPSVQAALAALREQLRHAIRQTNQMLALARADSCDLDTEAVDLAELASEVTRSRWPQARAKDIDLGLETPEQSTWVQVQRELLEEALANLIDNALRYTPAGGRITVEVAVDARAASLGVRDSGPGIPPAELPRAMQRFFRASNAQGAGSGLGLAIVASIARRHQGRLELLRAPQEGGLWARIGLPRAGALPTAPSADRTP
ncbi:sensor histidine kinase [Comamonas endophytica]